MKRMQMVETRRIDSQRNPASGAEIAGACVQRIYELAEEINRIHGEGAVISVGNITVITQRLGDGNFVSARCEFFLDDRVPTEDEHAAEGASS